MYLAPYPEHTKQTRCNNNLNLESKQDFFRPILSNVSIPITSNHEHYLCDNNAITMHQLDIERSSVSTRNNVIDNKKPVQQDFQNNYHTMNFDNLNHVNNQEINRYLTRNPVNTRRDDLEKVRNQEKQNFMKNQGGMLSNFADIRCENTRKFKEDVNSTKYVPMPRTMAVPKEKV